MQDPHSPVSQHVAMAMVVAEKVRLVIIALLVVFPPQHRAAVSYYYITPVNVGGADNQTCTVSDHVLAPCYHLDGFQEVLLASEDSVTLLFLSGVHKLPAGYSLNADYRDNFTVAPWKTSVVKIDCSQHAAFMFSDVSKLFISSIAFMSCTLQYSTSQTDSLETHTYYAPSAVFLNCDFTGRGSTYSLVFKSIHSIRIDNCTFVGTSGAVWSVETEYHMHMTELLIRNCVFLRTTRNATAAEVDGPLPLSGPGDGISAVGNNGGALHIDGAMLTMTDCRFVSSTAAGSGGACYLANSRHTMIADTVFEGNSAASSGGALHIFLTTTTLHHCIFRNNFAQVNGGALYAYGVAFRSNLLITANTTFQFNRALISGGAVYSASSDRTEITISSSYFSNNFAINGGSLYLANSSVILGSWIEIANNTASEKGGAIYATNSLIDYGLCNICRLAYNRAETEGGALFLDASFLADCQSYTSQVHFDHNMVTSPRGQGGAIFVVDKDCAVLSSRYHQCFAYIFNPIFPKRKLLFFTHNRAHLGSVLYGGALDRCLPPSHTQFHSQWSGIDAFKTLAEYESTPLAITSQPMKLCTCDDNFNTTDCSLRFFNITKLRGGKFELRLAVLDQDDNPRPSTIRASYREVASALDKGEGSQETSSQCKSFGYHIFTADSEAELLLEPVGPCQQSNLSVHITIMPCSRGFEQKDDRCVCDRRLTRHLDVNACNIDSDSTASKGSIWLMYDDVHLKMSRNCPLDYCQVPTNISFSSPDKQCASHHSGILCGACQDNHSIALGTSACLQCTSSSRVWLLPMFAAAGIALVAFLLLCNLTISKGTVNGLIFYANVISISGLTNLHNCQIHPALSVFIAWLNLDLGIETCFYPGLDTYQKTWLQFCFPLYIWVLVIATIVASHFSSRAMRLFGRNNIAILATLFLLSYNKILKTIITALTFTDVLVSRADNVTDQVVLHKVWTYDGNVDYLEGKHIPLLVVSLLFLVALFLPYTFLLMFGQCLRSLSMKRRWLRWTQSTAFISILDAYHAPYHSRHRYWTGLMLLTRCLLFLAFATYRQDHVLITHMFAITLVVMGVLAIKMYATKIYKQLIIDILDVSFLLNLGIVSATLYYLKGKGNADSMLCTSVTASLFISFLTFLGILVYHVYLQMRKREWFLSLRSAIAQSKIWHNASSEIRVVKLEKSASIVHKKLPTSTTVELREILLSAQQ